MVVHFCLSLGIHWAQAGGSEVEITSGIMLESLQIHVLLLISFYGHIIMWQLM